jgi:hypothetical protein
MQGNAPPGLPPIIVQLIERSAQPLVLARPGVEPDFAETSISPALGDQAEGITPLAAPAAILTRAASLPGLPLPGSLAMLSTAFGQRIAFSFLMLAPLQPAAGIDSGEPAGVLGEITAIKGTYLTVARPVFPPNPGASEVPAPEEADLITRFSPFEATPIEESFSRLVERLVNLDSTPESSANRITPVILIVAGLGALEASRRWRMRARGGAKRFWLVRRSAMHHPI